METFYFVLPAYNEAENIDKTIAQWYPVVEKINDTEGCAARLIIANDGSKDDTYERMVRLKEQSDLVHFEPLNKPNGGHGQTVLHLYRYALEQGADYIFQTDSDGQTNPDEFWQMFEHRHEFDFQVGFRKGRQDGFSRIVVTKTLRLVVRLMFHVWVTDANTPFRLMKREKLEAIMKVIPADYALCNVVITAIAVKWHYKLRFYEIEFKPRQGGINSINLPRIVKIGWKSLSDFYQMNRNVVKDRKAQH